MICDERLIPIMDNHCPGPVEVYARVCGFFRPVSEWNKGKREEFRQRKTYRAK